jgi:hypothetical protein
MINESPAIKYFMNDFWNNISRYPRFFISSLAGLILIILTPFRNLLKIQKFRIFALVFILLFFVVLYLIIINMTAI